MDIHQEAHAVLAHRLGLQVHVLARQRAVVHLAPVAVLVRRAQRQLGPAQHFLAAVAAERLVGGIHVDDAELGVAQHERIGGGIEDGAVLLLVGAQALFLRLAPGDVAANVEDVRLALVGHGHAAHLDIDPAAVGRGRGRLKLDVFAADRALVQFEQVLTQLLRYDDQPIDADQVLAPGPRGRKKGGIDVDDAIVCVAQHQRVGGRVEHGAVLGFARAQHVLGAPALDLGADARGEDLQHRLDERLVGKRLARQHREQAGRLAARVVQRGRRIALDAELLQLDVLAEQLAHAPGVVTERAAHGIAAGRARQRVDRVLHQLAVDQPGDGAEMRARRQLVDRDLSDFHAQDRGERGQQFLVDLLALGAGDRERCFPQAVFHLSRRRTCSRRRVPS